ncbi:MAG: hypothetical protein K8L97_23630 [Anaerolineae bacterium]|nr:hypothetical protein [Anaerolineae bacterium]
MTKTIAILISLLAVALAACGAGLNLNIDEQGNLGITVELQEATVNNIIRDAVVTGEGDQIFTEITSVDLKPGVITVNGTRQNTAGNFDLSMASDGGALRAQITAVNVEGLNLESPEIVRANEELATAFRQSASASENVRFDSVEITDTTMKFVITIVTATATPGS